MTDIAGRFAELGDRTWTDVPPGYVFRWPGPSGTGPNRPFDLLKRADYNAWGPAWLVRCVQHWTYASADTADEGNRLGTSAGRMTWCTQCTEETKPRPRRARHRELAG